MKQNENTICAANVCLVITEDPTTSTPIPMQGSAMIPYYDGLYETICLPVRKTQVVREDHRRAIGEDPVLKLAGMGKEIWKGIDPDNYVREEREGWD